MQDNYCAHFQGPNIMCGNSANIIRNADYNYHSPSTVIRLRLIECLGKTKPQALKMLHKSKNQRIYSSLAIFSFQMSRKAFDVLTIRWNYRQFFFFFSLNYKEITIMICFYFVDFVWLSLRGQSCCIHSNYYLATKFTEMCLNCKPLWRKKFKEKALRSPWHWHAMVCQIFCRETQESGCLYGLHCMQMTDANYATQEIEYQ